MRRKDSLRGAETAKISVRLGNYSASHFEGSATHDAQPSRMDFFSQTIRESLERVLGRRILPYISPNIESYTRVYEHYLTAAQSEHGEEGLRQCVGGAR